jgi:hypothetical protein
MDARARRPSTHPGFLAGAVIGAAGAAAGVSLADPATAGDWLARNLGHSVWAFGAVLAAWAPATARLARLLDGGGEATEVVRLDQLTDVAISVFVGVGVIWTAVGMRAALQTTLGDPGTALQGSAGAVLTALVEGGILLALTTTIVGAVGGYLMRLAKTLWVGPALHRFYDAEQGRELRALLDAVRRIEARIATDGTEAGSRARAA